MRAIIEKDSPCYIAAAPCPKENAALEVKAVALPPALREIQLTVAAAEEMRRVLDDENHPAHTGHEMPTADASILLNQIP